MINILHVLPKAPIGGVGSFLINTLKNINTDEIHFDFLIIEETEGSTFQIEVESFDCKVYKIEEKLSLYNFLKLRRKLVNTFQCFSIKYDILHLHSPNIGFLILPIAKKYGIKCRIIHSHATKYSHNSKLKSLRNRLIELPNPLYANDYIACSKEAGNFLFKNHSFTIIYNGVSTHDFFSNTYEKGNKIIIGHVGNFVPIKNHDFILKIIKEYKKNHNNFEFWFIGDGTLRSEFEENIKKTKLDSCVKFWGRQSDVNSLYQKMDCFILPSISEGFPVSAIEAQSMGVYCVLSDKITKEAKVTEACTFIGIDDFDLPNWCFHIDSFKNYDKNETMKEFRSSGLDIATTSKSLVQHYESLVK